MGQAKARGSRQERIAAAQEKQRNQEPINIPCKTCGEVLNGFTLLHNSAAGAAWQKKCKCGAITTAVVQTEWSTLERALKSTLGLANEITQGDPKVSVSFIEKNLDTVETGIVRL